MRTESERLESIPGVTSDFVAEDDPFGRVVKACSNVAPRLTLVIDVESFPSGARLRDLTPSVVVFELVRLPLGGLMVGEERFLFGMREIWLTPF